MFQKDTNLPIGTLWLNVKNNRYLNINGEYRTKLAFYYYINMMILAEAKHFESTHILMLVSSLERI